MSVLLLLCASTAGAAVRANEVAALALAHSPELRALDAGVAEARAGAIVADPFRSSASIAATPAYATGLPVAILGQVPAIGTIEAHRLLYDPGARAEQLAGSTRIDDAVSRLETRKREIAQSAVELAARVEGDGRLVDTARRRLAALESISARVLALSHEGRARELDVSRASIQTESGRRALIQAEARQNLDRFRLAQMIGERVEAVELNVVAIAPPSLGPRAMAKDPTLRSLSARIATLEQAVSLSRRLLLPTVAAQVQYSRLFERSRRYFAQFTPNDVSIGASLSLPLWTGGGRSATSARLTAQLRGLVAMRDQRQAELELAVREAEADFNLAVSERELAVRLESLAREGVRIAGELAREGRGEGNDSPQAQIALSDAEDEVTNATVHVVSAHARLLALAGELIP